jgi:hypothetical protein
MCKPTANCKAEDYCSDYGTFSSVRKDASKNVLVGFKSLLYMCQGSVRMEILRNTEIEFTDVCEVLTGTGCSNLKRYLTQYRHLFLH